MSAALRTRSSTIAFDCFASIRLKAMLSRTVMCGYSA